MAFDAGSVISISGGVMSVDLAAINAYLTGTSLDITTTTTKKGAAIKALLDYLVASADETTYGNDPTYPVTASNGEFDSSPVFKTRGTTVVQQKSYTINCYSGAATVVQNFDPDDMAY